MLGFMIRLCDDFDAALVFKSLYSAHVRSHLEYATVVWNPSNDVHINWVFKKKNTSLANL